MKKKEKREWTDIGGDLEASYDGFKYVDFRMKGSHKKLMFASKELIERALSLFPNENRENQIS